MTIKLGLSENWQQFSLLVLVNAFVGGMIGLERTILPAIAETIFDIKAKTAILSFIIVFGITKAIANFVMGKLANTWGRKKLLILGWLFGLPVPFILMFALSWKWIILANILLGINQGLAWSSTVIMKIDLVGEKNRGLAMGINEFAGYLSVGLVAFVTGWIATNFGLRPYPFYLGIGMAILGLAFSIFLIKDTQKYTFLEHTDHHTTKLNNIFLETTWTNPNLGSITQAGLVNNLNDGMIWGLLPLFLIAKGYDLEHIGLIAAIYPMVWGIGQLFTGKMADYFSKKKLIFWGMILQGTALLLFPFSKALSFEILISVLLGWGTAIVYPTFLAAIAENTNPSQRAESIGVFRLWRDLGYAVGALLSGIIADQFGILYAILIIGILTLLSGLIVNTRMKNNFPTVI